MVDQSGVTGVSAPEQAGLLPEKIGLGVAATGGLLAWKGNELSGLDPVFGWSADQADQDLVVILEDDQGCLTGETVSGQSYVSESGCPPTEEIISGALAHTDSRPVEITDEQVLNDQPDLADISAMVDARIDQVRNDAVEHKTDVVGSIVIGAGLAVTAISRIYRRFFGAENGDDTDASNQQPAPPPAQSDPPAQRQGGPLPARRGVVVRRPGQGSQGSPATPSP